MIVQKFPDDDTISFTKETLNFISTSLILNQINATPKLLEVTQTKNVLFLSLKSGPLSKPLSKMEKVDKFFDTQYPWAFVVRKEQKGL